MNSSITTTSSLSVSPCILNIETRLNLPGALSGAGYLSVFDIIRQSQSQFIRRNKGLLKEQSEQAYCLALGLANQVRRAFRKNQLTASVQKALPRTLSGQRAVAPLAGGAQQGLMTGGPSWQTQFSDDLTAYCQSGAPEADDSPVAYLSWLYDQARSFEQSASEAGLNIIKLEDRRPDLPELMVNDEAINQVVPSLQLVNQILEAAITPSITGSTVDETLAVTRYPSVLPYHAPHDQVELSLDNAGVPLSGVIGQTDISWPYFVSATLTGNNSEQACALGSQLAPGQQTILTEATNAPSKAFYKANFGYDTDSYTPFADPDLLAYQAGITIPQLEQLIASNCGGPGTSVVASPNVPTVSADASQYGAVFVNSGSTPAMDLEVTRHGYVDVISGNDTNRLFLATNATPTAGLYNAGLTTYIQPNSYAYFDGNSDVATLMRGDKDFTLSFWLYRLSLTDYQMPIFSNSGSCAQLSYSPGFSLSTYGNTSKAGVALNISDDTDKDHSTSGWDTSVEINQWTYIAMVWTASTRIADVYVVKDGNSAEGANITVDASTLGNIYTADNFTWAFNALGDLDTSDFPTNGTRFFIYDEIAVFAGCLTADQISDITTSNKPLSDLIDSPDITSSPWIAPSHYYPLDSGLHNLSDANMDRINRMVRLQRWLDLPYEQVDLLLSACARAQGQNNTDFSSNTHTLRMLGVFRQFQKKYQTTAYDFAAIINQITPYAISPNVPFFDQVFNSPSLFETPFAITDENFSYPPGTADDERIVKQICAGLKISEAQFGALAGHVMAKQGDSTNETLKCSLEVVSAFYRLAMLPRWMGLSFAEGVALFSLLADGQMVWNTLAGVPQLAPLDGSPPQPKNSDILDVLMALDSAADWAKSHSQSWIKNYLILQDTLEHPVPNTNVLNVVTSINQQLPAALLTETDFDDSRVPAAPDTDGWMGALSTLLDIEGLVQPVVTASGTTVYDTLNASVTAIVDTMTFDPSCTQTREQIANSLTTVIYQALLTQNGIADSALAQLLGTPQSLSTFLLQWATDSEYRLLSDTLKLNGITAPAGIPDAYLQALYQLGRRASVVTQYHLTPATLNCFLAHPDWFGVTDPALTLTLLYRLSRYADWLTLSGKEDAVLAYLNWVNDDTSPNPDPATAATALADLLDWDKTEVQDAAGQFGTASLALTVRDVDGVMRLQTLSEETGLSVKPLLSIGKLTLNSTYSDWQAAGESLVAAQSAQQ